VEVPLIKRIAAIAFIFICTSIAWVILGSTIFARTYSSDDELKRRVNSTWGTSQVQVPPSAVGKHVARRNVEETVKGQKRIREVEEPVTTNYPLESSSVDVDFNLEHRQKRLLWYSTYKVKFAGLYSFRNISGKDENVVFALRFPAAKAVYDDLVFQLDGQRVPITKHQRRSVRQACGSSRQDRSARGLLPLARFGPVDLQVRRWHRPGARLRADDAHQFQTLTS
jgi:hypothetical protein